MKTIKLATVFSGIGAIEQALIKMKMPFEIIFACDNGEREIDISFEQIMLKSKECNWNNAEINKYVKDLYLRTNKENMMRKSYFSNYEIDDEKWYEDIRFIDGKKYTNKVDLFVGGSPCQSFSISGKRAGLEDARGTLFYEYARLINEMKPKVFIYENVVGMLNHNRGNTWKVIKEIFESLGYDLHIEVLNAKDYGIPQDRKRLFVVGFKNKKDFTFPKKIELKVNTFDFLETKVEPRHYLGKKGFEFVTNPKYKNRARVNKEIIQTQKANQQFNWNGDFIFEEFNENIHNELVRERGYLGIFNEKKGYIRQLTYRECYRLMGFSDSFKIIDSNVWAYRQSGNSIVVNVLEHIMKEIIKVGF